MYSRQLKKIIVDANMLQQVSKYNYIGGWDSKDSIVRDFKNNIKTLLVNNQQGKCAYCELSLDTRGPEIEHIAKKSKYYGYTFYPDNLVMACHSCNQPTHKGNKDVVLSNAGNYNSWMFKIVHPYFDNPSDYFDYNVPTEFIISVKAGLGNSDRAKARETISIFDLNSPAMIEERVKDYYYEQIKATGDIDRIREISSYKEK